MLLVRGPPPPISSWGTVSWAKRGADGVQSSFSMLAK